MRTALKTTYPGTSLLDHCTVSSRDFKSERDALDVENTSLRDQLLQEQRAFDENDANGDDRERVLEDEVTALKAQLLHRVDDAAEQALRAIERESSLKAIVTRTATELSAKNNNL